MKLTKHISHKTKKRFLKTHTREDKRDIKYQTWRNP